MISQRYNHFPRKKTSIYPFRSLERDGKFLELLNFRSKDVLLFYKMDNDWCDKRYTLWVMQKSMQEIEIHVIFLSFWYFSNTSHSSSIPPCWEPNFWSLGTQAKKKKKKQFYKHFKAKYFDLTITLDYPNPQLFFLFHTES